MLERQANGIDRPALRCLRCLHPPPARNRRILDRTTSAAAKKTLSCAPVGSSQFRTTSAPFPRDGAFLGFLYPPGTLQFALKLSRKAKARAALTSSKRAFYGTWRQEQTSATTSSEISTAVRRRLETMVPQHKSIPASSTSILEETATEEPPPMILEGESPGDYLDRLRKSRRGEDFDKVCMLRYQTADPNNHRVIEYLCRSPRVVDAERICETHDTVAIGKRSPRYYRIVIAALIRLRKVNHALRLHEEAKRKGFDEPFGSEILLAYCIGQKYWELAFHLWQKEQRRRAKLLKPRNNLEGVPELWAEVERLPDLSELALSLGNYTKGLLDLTQFKSLELSGWRSSILTFTRLLFSSALYGLSAPLPSSHVKPLFAQLEKLDLGSKEVFERTIMRFLKFGEDQYAAELYWEYRGQRYFRPGHRFLRRMLFSFQKSSNVPGIEAVLDDHKAVGDVPSKGQYYAAIHFFGRKGVVVMVERLFKESVKFHGQPNSEWDLNECLKPRLEAYARLGDLQTTTALFNELRTEYRDIQPNLGCWHSLLRACGKADNVIQASRIFEQMLELGDTSKPLIKPNETTFDIMTDLAAKRGDVDIVQDLLGLAKERQVALTANMIAALVMAHLKNEDTERADRIVREASSIEMRHPRTKMWNLLINAWAHKRDIKHMMTLFEEMKALGIEPDGSTYGSVMQGLSKVGHTNAAYAILRKTMPSHRVPATAYHYAIIMRGFIRDNDCNRALEVYKHLEASGIAPTLNAKAALIHATAMSGLKPPRKGTLPPEEELGDPLQRAEDQLQRIMEYLDEQEIANEGSTPESFTMPDREVYPAEYYDFLIYMCGERKAFEKVDKFFDESIQQSESSQSAVDVVVPYRLLLASLIHAYHRGNHAKVERCWRRAKDRATELRRSWKFSSGNRISAKDDEKIPAARANLALPLYFYLRSLRGQGELTKLQQTVDEVRDQGFEFDTSFWNLYIQALGRASDPVYAVKAFVLCETHLMDGWKGWRKQRKVLGLKRLPRARTLKTRPIDGIRPKYHTLVYLAAALIQLRRTALSDSTVRRLLDKVYDTCPRTIEALQNMPKRDDMLQPVVFQELGDYNDLRRKDPVLGHQVTSDDEGWDDENRSVYAGS